MKNFYHLRNILALVIWRVKKQEFLVYFKKMTICKIEEWCVTFGVVSEFMKWNLEVKFHKVFLETAQIEFPWITDVKFAVDPAIDSPSNSDVVDCLEFFKEANRKKWASSEAEQIVEIAKASQKKKELKYTLKNFVVGPDNQLAHSACMAISKDPGKSYNPLYLYWDVWLGKTHLLQATWNEVKKKLKDMIIVYTTWDKFLNDYVNCVKQRSVDKLRQKFLEADVLIIDDVQFLENKKQTQAELYNIFNLLYEADKQIIISGDRPPRELTELEPRLRSRFEWWITIDIGKPDFETRLAIIQEKSRTKEFLLPQEVAEFIAANVTENVREIEWVLNQLIIEYDLEWTPPTLDKIARKLKKLSITDDILGATIWKDTMKIKTYDDLLDIVSSHFWIEKEWIIGWNRKKEFMVPRQVAMYLLKKKMRYTYERIWNIFSGRNHASVLYSCNKLEQIIKKDKNLLYEINVIRDKIGL